MLNYFILIDILMLKSNKMIDKIFLEYSQQSHKSYNFLKPWMKITHSFNR